MKLFVWDFHGVLEKGTEEAVLEISNEVLKRFGYSQRFTEEDIAKLFGLKWFEYFEYLLPKDSHERHLALQEHCFEKSNNSPEIIAKHIQPNLYVREVLSRIAQKHCQILISNTHPKSLRIFLDSVQITPYFPEKHVFAVNIHQQHTRTKKVALKKFLKDKKFDKIIVISDSPSDKNLVSVAGGTFYLYSHLGRPFKDCDADYRINDLRELLKEI
jgi:beta-phosphoglucomutase-like phosphatase (HAD superfamily)